MHIGIIDADLVGRKNHRFPNLASMKISAYHKSVGDKVSLLLSYDDVGSYDKVYVSKAFTDTYVPEETILMANVSCGGTGFFTTKLLLCRGKLNTADQTTICMTSGSIHRFRTVQTEATSYITWTTP